jgi:tetratricopeptide (TPR) repeat protein
LRQLRKESYDLAAELFEQALKLDPELALAQVGLGQVQYERYYRGWEGQLANLEQAETRYLQALTHDPALAAAHDGLIRVRWIKGDSLACLNQGQKIAKLGRGDVDSLYTRAAAYAYGGLPDKAIPLLKRVIEDDPQNEAAYGRLGQCHSYLGQFDEAVKTTETAARLFGDKWGTALQRGVAYHGLGDVDRARAAYLRAMDLLPDDWHTHLGMGALLRQTGRGDDAKQHFTQGLEIVTRLLAEHAHNPRLRTWKAIFHGQLGDRAGLLREEALVLSEPPVTALLYFNLGTARAALGDVDQGVAFFRQAHQMGCVDYDVENRLRHKGLECLESCQPYQEHVKAVNETRARLRTNY